MTDAQEKKLDRVAELCSEIHGRTGSYERRFELIEGRQDTLAAALDDRCGDLDDRCGDLEKDVDHILRGLVAATPAAEKRSPTVNATRWAGIVAGCLAGAYGIAELVSSKMEKLRGLFMLF